MKKLEFIDKVSAPIFVSTILLEAAVLRKQELRQLGDLDDYTREELSDPTLPPDPLRPVGYERRDTIASLTMFAGSLAFNFAFEYIIRRNSRFLFRHRIANVSESRGSFLKAMLLWDFLYYWDHRWMHEVRLF